MSTQFFSNLSRNYIEILEDSEYYDVTIEVGEDPNVKIFRAHMNILCHRSPYLRRALVSNNKKNNNDSVLSHTKLPNILPEIFQIVLKYIYGGILSLDEENTSDILKVLIAADELILHELVDYLQTYLIKNKADWLEKHFELIHRTSFQSNNLLELQKFCTEFMAKSPDKIFESLDFTSLPEKSLVSLLKRDDLRMKEIEVWEHVLKWGLTQNPTLTPDPVTWTDDDFKTMENSLQYCLPLIRFYSLSSKDFLRKVRPYKKLLKRQLYEDLLGYYLDFESEPSNNFLPPRNVKFDSKIINPNIISLVSKWVDKAEVESGFACRNCRKEYEFKLLLRGSRDGFTPDKFHSLCDNISKTVTFIKVKGTDEILGGYNPIIWETNKFRGETKDSFIFSFKYKNGLFKDEILSNVKEINRALSRSQHRGPSFGDSDLILYGSNQTRDYDKIYCKQGDYEKRIRDTEDKFLIDDYEVFQIIKF
ncbi:unnamed protein product [Rhizophagus irregularis]|nr:unnamed protein product [Rhizophagus irregularis]